MATEPTAATTTTTPTTSAAPAPAEKPKTVIKIKGVCAIPGRSFEEGEIVSDLHEETAQMLVKRGNAEVVTAAAAPATAAKPAAPATPAKPA